MTKLKLEILPSLLSFEGNNIESLDSIADSVNFLYINNIKNNFNIKIKNIIYTLKKFHLKILQNAIEVDHPYKPQHSHHLIALMSMNLNILSRQS